MSFTTLKGISDFGDYSLSEIIKGNLIFFLNWAFVDKGAYFNVTRPTSGVYGGDWHKLRPVKDPNFDNGQVWESNRNNWVWETGAAQPTQPIRVSGVYVDGVFHSDGSDHYIDYSKGQIVFNSGITTSANVEAEYSWRYINIYQAEDIPWFKQSQYRSQRVDNPHFNQFSSGEYYQLAQTRVQLPAVAIELGRRYYEPYALGGGQYAYTDVIFHILTEDANEADKISDYLSFQNEKTIFLIDFDYLAESGVFPLDYRGVLVSGAKTYPDLVKSKEEGGFRFRKITFLDSEAQDGRWLTNEVYFKNVRSTTEVVVPNI